MSTKSDELRGRLPHVAAELDYSIDVALAGIRSALKNAGDGNGDVAQQAWRKGMYDALKFLRPAQEAHKQFRKWLAEVLEQEIDACGLTAEERARVAAAVRGS